MAELPTAAVLGLGPVGGSIALALRETGHFGAVVGWDPDFDTARTAQRRAVADRFVRSAPDAARQAAIAFIALRGDAFGETLVAVAPHLKPGAIACSLEEAHETAAAQAAKILPGSVSFLSAHPISWDTPGSEPSASRFARGIWCVSPLATAHENAVGYVAQLGERLGMQPFFLDAREHDAFASGLQHLPTVLAAVLMRVATAQPSWRELSRLAGASFREATEPLQPPAEAQQSGLTAHREHLVRWLDAVIGELTSLREGLQDGREPADYFEQAIVARAKWLADRDVPAQAAELPRVDAPPRRRFPF